MNIILITFRRAVMSEVVLIALLDADNPTADEQKSEQRYETAFVSLPYRRRIFHSFREAGEQKDLPGNAF